MAITSEDRLNYLLLQRKVAHIKIISNRKTLIDKSIKEMGNICYKQLLKACEGMEVIFYFK